MLQGALISINQINPTGNKCGLVFNFGGCASGLFRSLKMKYSIHNKLRPKIRRYKLSGGVRLLYLDIVNHGGHCYFAIETVFLRMLSVYKTAK